MERNSKCTAPAVLAESMPPLPPEAVTIDGTLAHRVLELCLKTGADAWEYVGDEFTQGEFTSTFTSEMADEIGEVVAHVRQIMTTARDDKSIFVEARLEMHEFPKMFGTADFVMVRNDDMIIVIDLKFGYIVIEPDALQLMIYLLMALLREHGPDRLWQGDPDEVIGITGVAQPHAFGLGLVRTHQVTRRELQKVHGDVMQSIARIERRELIWQAGDHCRYCHIAPTCPRLAQVASDAVAAQLFHDPEVAITGAELDEALEMVPALKLYIKRIEELGQQYLEAGGNLASRKLVWKRAVRKWKDEAEAQGFLLKNNVDPYLDPKLKSPAQAEKDLPKSQRSDLGAFVSKESSGLTTAASGDPRKPVNRQISDQARQQAKIAADKIKKGVSK